MLKLKTIFVRKPMNYEHLLYDQKELMRKFNTTVEEFKIETVVELTHDEFEEFKSNLLAERDFCKDNNCILLVKEKGSANNSGLIIDARGSNYPRYVGIPMQEVDLKKCPKCSKVYFDDPAISRDDNESEICPACGLIEAFEACGIDIELMKMLENLQNYADKFDARIIVKRSNHDDIVLAPKGEEPADE